MTMKCSTGKIILVLLCVVIAVQFCLQLMISYLERGTTGKDQGANVGNGGRGFHPLESIPLIGKFKRHEPAAAAVVVAPPVHVDAAIGAKTPLREHQRQEQPRKPPPETIIRPFIPPSPECIVTVKEAKSALNRAQTAECRDELQRVSCAHQQDMLYWTNFTRTCPVKDNPAIGPNMTLPKLHPDVPRVRILFMITVHGRPVRQVYRVLKALYHVNHFYYIHVDARSHFMLGKMTELAKKYDNVRVTPWRLATIWGGASLLQMLLRAMDDVYAMTDWNWDYFVNLSESDFPFKNFTYIVDYLTAWRKYNFLRAHGKQSPRFIHKQGLDQTFFECEHHMWRIGPRRLPQDIHIDGGSDWIMVNREYVDYLVSSKDPIALGLKHMFSYSLLPAESFFHTLLRNGPLCQTMVKNNLRLANWKRSLGCRCQYKAIVDWCGCSPNDFTSGDFDKIKGMSDKLFGRKFEAVVNQDVINRLDFHLFGEYPSGTPALDAYWENVYNADDFGESYDDTTMTLYRSVTRLLRSELSQCVSAGDLAHVEDVHLYRRNDAFEALIIKIRYGPADNGGVFEVKLTPKVQSTKALSNLRVPSFREMSVGAKFDKKEYIYRNYASVLGLATQVTFVMRHASGTAADVTLNFIAPSGLVVKSRQLHLKAEWSLGDVAVDFEGSAEPGVWTVDVSSQSPAVESVGSVQFVLYPREFDNTEVVVDQAGLERVGLKNYLHVREGLDFREQLEQYVDSITSKAWLLSGTCCMSQPGKPCPGLVQCSMTPWSSLSPDPKSDLSEIKPNGRIR